MKKDLGVLAAIAISVFAIYHFALFTFFAQDDFILINQFSQNAIWQDIKNAFGLPKVTHWRPVHNLYFLIGGNIFGQNYVGYHTITFILHIGASFLIYKTLLFFVKNRQVAMLAGLLYGVHPAHFVSLFWISGGATTIGIFFLMAAFYSYLDNKKTLSLILFLLALLAAEAMLAGLTIFLALEFFFRMANRYPWPKSHGSLFLAQNSLYPRPIRTKTHGRRHERRVFLTKMIAGSIIFFIIKLLFFTSKTTFDIYNVELSFKTILAIRYYVLRTLGFAETSGDIASSILLSIWIILIGIFLLSILGKTEVLKRFIFFSIISFAGLFPFILIPNHLSPHYINISIMGFSGLIALAFLHLNHNFRLLLTMTFLALSIYNIGQTYDNNWVIRRSNLARTYIQQIERNNPSAGSTIIFADTQLSTSEEAYIVLGTGKAIKFWFEDKKYTTCFTRFEKCTNFP